MKMPKLFLVLVIGAGFWLCSLQAGQPPAPGQVVLQSADGQGIPISVEAAKLSTTLKNLLDDLKESGDPNDQPIPLPNISFPILKTMVSLLEEIHKQVPNQEAFNKFSEERKNIFSKDIKEFLDTLYKSQKAQLTSKGAFFAEVAMGANYLDIEPLLPIALEKLTDYPPSDFIGIIPPDLQKMMLQPMKDYLLQHASPQILLTLRGRTDRLVHSVAFSPDGSKLATGSQNDTVIIWDVNTGAQHRHQLREHTNRVVRSVAFSPDGSKLATGLDNDTVIIWDLKTGAEIRQLRGWAGAFSPDGSKFATGSKDNTAIIWDVNTGAQHRQLRGHTGLVNSVAFSPDGSKLATGSKDNTAIIWDVNTGAQHRQLRGHTHWVHSVAFSPDGSKLATGSWDNTAIIWDVNTGAQHRQLRGHTRWLMPVAFSPDGSKLATGSADKTAIIWDVNTGTQFHQLSGHTNAIGSVAFSPDGSKLATGSFDKTAIIWDISVLNRISTFFLNQITPAQSSLLLTIWYNIKAHVADPNVQPTITNLATNNEAMRELTNQAVFDSLPQEIQNALRNFVR